MDTRNTRGYRKSISRGTACRALCAMPFDFVRKRFGKHNHLALNVAPTDRSSL